MGEVMTLRGIADIEMTQSQLFTGASPDGNDCSYQPAGVRLDNDGCWSHWVMGYTAYLLRHDGVGWTVTPADTGKWIDGHVRRLADQSGPRGTFVSSLPGVDGVPVELNPVKVYQLQHGADGLRLSEFC